MADEPDRKLSPEAQLLILQYLKSLLVPVLGGLVVVFSISGGLVGYMSTTFLKQTLDPTIEKEREKVEEERIAISKSLARTEAEATAKIDSIKRQAADAEEVYKKSSSLLNTIKGLAEATSNINDLQNNLAKNSAFISAIAKQVGTIEIRLSTGTTRNGSDYEAACEKDEVIVGGACIITKNDGYLQNQGLSKDKYYCTYSRRADPGGVQATVYAACLRQKSPPKSG